ncbi:TPA: hypothetical protein ACX87D_001615 [Legionella pneumophila]
MIHSFFTKKKEIEKTSSPCVSLSYPPTVPPKFFFDSPKDYSVTDLLYFVIHGNWDVAVHIAQRNPELLFKKVHLLTSEGEELISPLQYALKQSDDYMVTNFYPIICWSSDYRQQFVIQADEKKSRFQFDALQKAYDNYLKNRSVEALKEIGREQRKLPSHLLKEFCRDTSESSRTWLTEPDLLPYSCRAYHPDFGGKDVLPLVEGKGLGSEYLLSRNESPYAKNARIVFYDDKQLPLQSCLEKDKFELSIVLQRKNSHIQQCIDKFRLAHEESKTTINPQIP